VVVIGELVSCTTLNNRAARMRQCFTATTPRL
jgi:hypothetical protein